MTRTLLLLSVAAVAALVLAGCNADSPPRGPEETCTKACAVRDTRCTSHECWRGCNLALDRLVEHETDHVLACVAATSACDDRTWARCATRIGPYADGGPPAPPPPPDVEDEDEP